MATISKAIIDTDLRAQTFAKLDLSDFSKVNDQTYGILLTDQNGVERYVRLRAVVAEVKDDMTAREYMESEIAAYNEKVAVKEAKKKERMEKAKKENQSNKNCSAEDLEYLEKLKKATGGANTDFVITK